MLSGRLFEDFVPTTQERALISTGLSLVKLTCIELAYWTLRANGRVRVTIPPPNKATVLARGKGLRLGGLFGSTLLYSDCVCGVIGVEVGSPTAHQPFLYKGSVYYTDDWPLVQIYTTTPGLQDRRLFLGHFGEYTQVGNPHWAPGGVMYFEARKDPDPCRPELWEVWKRLPDGTVEKVCQGANPSYFDGRLFWGEWNGRAFTYQCTTIN